MTISTKAVARHLTIGVDFDDIIILFNDGLHEYHNAIYGTSVKRSDITTYDIHDVWGCEPHEAVRRVHEFYRTSEHDSLLPVEGVVDALARLKKDHDLHIITSRGEETRELTERWIARHFPGTFSSVVFTNGYSEKKGKKRTKVEVCDELGVDLMIEDSLSQAQAIAGSGRRVILLDCPWNQGACAQNIVRVSDWKGIEQEINTYAHTL